MKCLLKLLVLFTVLLGFSMSLCAHNKVAMEVKRRIPVGGTTVDPSILRGPILELVSVFIDSKTLSVVFLESEGTAHVCVVNSTTGNVVFSREVFMSDALTIDLSLEKEGEYLISIDSGDFLSWGCCSID